MNAVEKRDEPLNNRENRGAMIQHSICPVCEFAEKEKRQLPPNATARTPSCGYCGLPLYRRRKKKPQKEMIHE
jgi:hypothetical protein